MDQKVCHAVGIDVSKKKLNVAIIKAPSFRKLKTKVVTNDQQGFLILIQWVSNQVKDDIPIHFIMEATGPYHLNLALFLTDHGYLVSVVNPAQIKKFGERIAARTKNDQKDCLIIAQFGALIRPSGWNPPPLEYRNLQQLLKRFEQLEKMIRQAKNRRQALQYGAYLAEVLLSVENSIAYMETERNSLLKQIEEYIAGNQILTEDVELLKSIPGIGELTAMRLACCLEGRQRFRSARQFAAYLGLTPQERQSGTSIKGKTRISKMGPKELRKALYMPAIVAKASNPDIKAIFDRLLKRGKCKMSALGAAMRKLAHIAFGVIKNRMAYSPMWCEN